MEQLEVREVPAFLAPIGSEGGGVRLGVADFNNDGRDDIASIKGILFSSGTLTDVLRVGAGATIELSTGDGRFQKSAALSGVKGYYLTGSAVSGIFNRRRILAMFS
jgi:hypothetical protein